MIKSRSFRAALGFFVTLSTPAFSQSLDDIARSELLKGWRTESGSLMAGLRISLASGWKTYWRAPGDAGIPPQFNWSGSENLASVSVSWPVPEVFEQNGLRSIGYADVVTLPLEFEPLDAGAAIKVSGRIEIGVCEDICIPMTLRLTAELPTGPGSENETIRSAINDRPMTRQEADVRVVGCSVSATEDGVRVAASIDMPRFGPDEAVVVELMKSPVWVSQPEVTRNRDQLNVTADIVPPDGAPFALERSALRFTILADGRAAEIQGCS